MITRFPLINAVLQGKQDGIVQYHKDFNFILSKAGFGFVALPNENKAALSFTNYMVEEKSLPQYFHLYDASPLLIEACSNQSKQFKLRLRKRIQLQYLQPDIPSTQHAHADFFVKQIEVSDLPKLDIFGLSLANKFWNSAEDFLSYGFGFIALDKNLEPGSICYSACVSDGLAEIDVATLPAFQNKGLAKTVVAAFVKHCNQQGMIANWDCFEENVSSLKTALSIGFKARYNYSLLSISKQAK